MVVVVGFFRYALFEAAGLEKLGVGLESLLFSDWSSVRTKAHPLVAYFDI